MPALDMGAVKRVLQEIEAERMRQHGKWGQQDLPDGTARLSRHAQVAVVKSQAINAIMSAANQLTFTHVLSEEYFEVMAETDPARLREELVQLAAVATQWVEAIDRREGRGIA